MSESTTGKGAADAGSDDQDNGTANDPLADLDLDDIREADDAGDDGGGADEGRGADGSAGGLSWPKVAVLGVALAFLGFAVAVFVNRDQSPSASSVDVGFYQDMITHHEQALELSQIELANGEAPLVRSMAMEVLNFQAYEIGYMDTTLQDWGYLRSERSDTAMTWMGMPVPAAEMPGMASEEEIDAFEDAEGAEADAMFLELMAEHHAGGVHMAEYAADNAESDEVRTWARRWARAQSIEINEYAAAAESLSLPVTIDRVDVPEA